MFRIRPLRLANFRGVLEQLAEEAAHDGESGIGRSVLHRLAGFWQTAPVFEAGQDDSAVRRSRSSRAGGVFDAYQQETALFEAPRAAASRSAVPSGKSDEEQVAEELRLSGDMTRAELRRRRRDYAMGHHPDRVPEFLRERATRRMSIANALIDGALHHRSRA